MQLFNIILVSLLSVTVSAQLNGLPTCAQGCVRNFTTGTEIGGCGALDIACICGANDFISGISCCLYANCNQADQQTSITFAHQICSTAGVQVPNAVVCPSASSTFGVMAGATGSPSSASSMASSKASATASGSGSKVSASASGASASASAAAKPNAGNSNAMVDLGFGVVGSLVAFFFL